MLPVLINHSAFEREVDKSYSGKIKLRSSKNRDLNSILFLAKSYLKKTSSASIRPLAWLEADNFKEVFSDIIKFWL